MTRYIEKTRIYRSKTTRLTAVVVFGFITLLGVSPSFAYGRAAPWVGHSFEEKPCIGPNNTDGFGPYDYTTDKDKLTIVERYHFTPPVEQLIKGENNPSPIGDITYTLLQFPNHHRALYSAIRYALHQSEYKQKGKYPTECFLQRAINFSPGDAVPHILFGLYLHRLDRLDRSLEEYKIAEKLSPNDPNLLYNLGLVYYDKENYQKSLEYANRAYAAGMELPGLKRKLQDAGHWK